MKLNDGFSLKYIAGVPYILPYGQNIADFKRGIRLDNTGALIIKLMQEHQDEDELIDALAEHFHASGDERLEIANDLRQFLDQLCSYEMIAKEIPQQSISENYCKTLKIGGIYIDLFGDERAFSRDFDPFSADRQDCADLTVSIHVCSPRIFENGKTLLRNSELCIIETDKSYLLIFPEKREIIQAALKKDGSRIDFYLKSLNSSLTTDMFHAIRPAFLYLAQKRGMFAIHSASILYKGRAWLFSGRSGMGKTTHTSIWNRLFGAPTINGDLNLITVSEGKALVHGIPWCGTSGICDTKTYPLGGIVLLGRGVTDSIETLSDNEKALLIMQRLISPCWTEDLLSKNIDFSSELIKHIAVCRLKCTKNPSAAERMKAWIDEAVSED